MDDFDYSKLLDELEADLNDLTDVAARKRLALRVAKLELELRQLKAFQDTMLSALLARDVVAREGVGRTLAPPARLIELTPRDAINVEGGLYPTEWDGGVCFRWTGPGQETVLRAWLDRSAPIVFELALHSYGDERNEGALELRVDGAPVPLQEAGEKLLRSDPLPTLHGSLFTEFAIRTPWMTEALAPVIAKKSRRHSAAAAEAQSAGARGFAFTHLRFIAAI